MATLYNPSIIKDGLMFCVDAKNPRSYPGSGTTFFDIAGTNNMTIYGSPTYNANGYFTFSNNQTTEYIMNSLFPNPTTAVTYNVWFRSNLMTTAQTPFTYSVAGDNQMLFYLPTSTSIQPHPKGNSAWIVTTSNMLSVWVNACWTRNSTTGDNILYRDGIQIGNATADAGINITTNGYLIIGQEADAAGGGFDTGQNLDGDFAYLSVYNRVLTSTEVLQNFNALKGRYGL